MPKRDCCGSLPTPRRWRRPSRRWSAGGCSGKRALGVRGVRASLLSPELLREQLRAILRVKPTAACRILLPMITDVSEVESVRRILNELCLEAGCPSPPLGVMIETPAAALL